jgi:carbamoyltransferase
MNPSRAENKGLLNGVKRREAFRPFAPAVIEEKLQDYFILDRPSPYMLLIAKVRKDAVDKIPAVTHVDGSGRLQTIRRGQNRDYYDLIKEFGRLKGIPLMINTSFNLRGEPIVRGREALDVFGLGPYAHRSVRELSLGQKRRATFAAAWIGEPTEYFLMSVAMIS